MKASSYILILLISLLVAITGLGCELGYTVYGVVTDGLGDPISEVTIDFSNGSDSVFTNLSGYWSKANVRGPVVVSARKFGWSFSPNNYLITEEAEANFIGSPESFAEHGSVSKRRTALPGMWYISYLLGDLDFAVKMSPASITIPGDGELSGSIPEGALITRVSVTINIAHDNPTEIVVWATTDDSDNQLAFNEFPNRTTEITHIWDGLTAMDRIFHIRTHDPVLINNGKINDVLIELDWVLL